PVLFPLSLAVCSLYCPDAHRHLHSFPTRRSSDLLPAAPTATWSRRPVPTSALWTIISPSVSGVPTRSRNSSGAAPEGLMIVHNRSEEHTSELQSRFDLVCRLLLEKKKKKKNTHKS